MTYNNFVSRISARRPLPSASVAKPVRPLQKKQRKAGRRRVAASLAITALVLCGIGETRAEEPERPIFIEWSEREAPMVCDHPLFEQFKAATAEMQTVAPQRRQPTSLLTMILLGGGVGVALFQLRLLRRADLAC